MHIWSELAVREAAFFVTLLALGVGPAALLSERVDGPNRWLLAPAFGMCVGVCITLTLIQWLPVSQTFWVLYPAAAASVVLALWRALRARTSWRLPLREAVQIAVVAAAVLAPASSALHARHTVGPVAYQVYDATGYVAEIDAQQHQPVVLASKHAAFPYHNLTDAYWDVYASGDQNMDVSALEGSLNDILDLHATDTQSPFMIVLLLVGALGAVAGFRYLTGSRSWFAVLPGVLFGGPFFMQLWADSSEAAIGGLALALPFVVVGLETLRGRIVDSCLLALIVGGMLSIYPLFVPQVAIGAAVALVVWIAWVLRRRDPGRRHPSVAEIFIVVSRIIVVCALSAAVTVVAFWRDVVYWKAVAEGGKGLFNGLPVYPMQITNLPGWLLQTRGLYYLPALGVGGLKEDLWSIVVPVVMLCLVALGLQWRRQAAVLLAIAAACALLGEYAWLSDTCSYCVQRNLLPVAPLGATAVAIGIAAVIAIGAWWAWVAGVALAAVVVVSVGNRMRVMRQQVLDTAYFMDTGNRDVLARLPDPHSIVDLEGYGTNPRAPGEFPLMISLVNERTGGRASVGLDSDDYGQNAYIGPADQPDVFRPDYRYILTQIPGVRTDDRVVARSGGVALLRRTHSLDVTAVAGLGVPFDRDDPSGAAYIQGPLLADPLTFFVAGGSSSRTAYVRIAVSTKIPVTIPPRPGVSYAYHHTSATAGRISACIRTTGRAPLRTAAIGFSFQPLAIPPATLYRIEGPTEGVRLDSMYVSNTACR